MKIKFASKPKADDAEPNPQPAPSAQEAGPRSTPQLEHKKSFKITLKKPNVDGPSPVPASAGEVTSKANGDSEKPRKKLSKIVKLGLGKRPRAPSDTGDELHGAPAKRKTKPSEKVRQNSQVGFVVPDAPAPRSALPKTPGLKVVTNVPPPPKGSIKLSFGSAKGNAPTGTFPKTLKVKNKGKPPVRPPGVGYDSEDEEAEIDPVIENQFVLRMPPGEDCEYLRKAIIQSGLKPKGDGKATGGPEVWMKFFDKDGRRGVISVRGNLYAASLLDLPCIVEAMKSWDKKGWYKTTDICQILVVLGRVQTEEEAKAYRLPPEVDKENWQYPHGLTPPMQWVRKRRFRPRVNRRHIERVEADVEDLLARDKQWEGQEGVSDVNITMEYVDPDAGDEDMDAEGEEDEVEGEFYGYQDENGNVVTTGGQITAAGDEDDDFSAQLEAAFLGNDDADPQTTITADPTPSQASPETPAAGADSALTPGPDVTGSEDASGSDDDDDDEPASEDEDEEEKATRMMREQILEEVQEIKNQIRQAEMDLKRQTNPLLQKKLKANLDNHRADLEIKMSGLGMSNDDE